MVRVDDWALEDAYNALAMQWLGRELNAAEMTRLVDGNVSPDEFQRRLTTMHEERVWNSAQLDLAYRQAFEEE